MRVDSGELAAKQRQAYDRRWISASLAVLGLAGVLAVGGYLAWANRLPSLPPDSRRLPNPNGLDRFLIAAANLPMLSPQSPLQDPVAANPDDLRKELAPHAEALAAVRKTVRQPFMNPAITSNERLPTYSLDFPNAARYLAALARLEQSAGRPRQALAVSLDAIELGSRAGVGGPAFLHETAREASSIGARIAERLVPALTAAEASAVAARLTACMERFPSFVEVAEEERRFRVATRHRLLTFRDPVWLHGRAPSTWAKWEAQIGLVLAPKPARFAAYQAHYDALVQYAGHSWPQRQKLVVTGPPLLKSFLDRAGDAAAHNDAQLRLLRWQLLLRAHRLRTGAYPAELASLAGKDERRLTLDPFTEQPLCYRRRGAEYLLYSAGADGRDDGGDPRRDLVAGAMGAIPEPAPWSPRRAKSR